MPLWADEIRLRLCVQLVSMESLMCLGVRFDWSSVMKVPQMKPWVSSMRQSCVWILLAAIWMGAAASEGAAQFRLGRSRDEESGVKNANPATPNPVTPNNRRRKDEDDDEPRSVPPGLPAANGVAGGIPGLPAKPGRPTQTGGPAPSQFPAGTTEDAIYRFCIAAADGDTATASDYIGHSAIGMAAKLREGELSEERIEEMIELLNPTADLSPSQTARPSNTKRTIHNKRGQTISFVLKKEKEVYKIVELSFTKPKEGRPAADTRDRS